MSNSPEPNHRRRSSQTKIFGARKLRLSGLPVVIASKSRIGRIRRAAKREFILSDGQPITIPQVLRRAYCRLRRFTWWHYLAARRALRSEGAIQIARCRFGRGRPGLWARKTAATILKHEQAEM